VHDGLLSEDDLRLLIEKRAPGTSLCLTGRNFPQKLLGHADIATEMHKIKHHFDEKFLANKGIDF
jgi:cob(I)alamin adenosyltransferase